MNHDWWQYDKLPSGEPYDWHEPDASRGDSPYDNVDFHLDIGCGTAKKGRLGIDRHLAPGVDLCIDLESLTPSILTPSSGGLHVPTRRLYDGMGLRDVTGLNGEVSFRGALPFPTGSIESIVTHHCFEHVAGGFVRLMDECHRVLKPGGLLRVIVPLFPSKSAVEDPDHKRWFMVDTFETFCGNADGTHWHESFSVPYTQCRFEMVDKDFTARLEDPAEWWGPKDNRELRVGLRKHLEEVGHAATGERDVQAGRGGSEGSAVHDPQRAAEAGRDADLAGVR